MRQALMPRAGPAVVGAAAFVLYRMWATDDLGPPPRTAATSDGLQAVVVGATGATGRQLVRRLIEADRWASVTAVVRRTPAPGELFDGDIPPPKLRIHIVPALDAPDEADAIVENWRGAHCLFNTLGTTRATAGSAALFKRVEVDLSAHAASLAQRAGIPCASVVSASGANPHAWTDPWEVIHPLLYMQTMGRKEQAMQESVSRMAPDDEKNIEGSKGRVAAVRAASPPPFAQLSIFRPGMLNRLSGDRTWENVFNRLGLGLRVDALASAMELDGAAMAAAVLSKPVAIQAGRSLFSRAAPSPHSPKKVQVSPVVYEGNAQIVHWAEAASWRA